MGMIARYLASIQFKFKHCFNWIAFRVIPFIL